MNRPKPIFIILGSLGLLTLVFLLQSPYWAALTKSRGAFIPSPLDDRVFYEKGAEEHAAQIARLLSDAVETVEEKHRSPFTAPFKVFVCNTQTSFNEFIARFNQSWVIIDLAA